MTQRPPDTTNPPPAPAPAAKAGSPAGSPPRTPGQVKAEIGGRLGDDWEKLADWLDIPTADRRRFKTGHEPQRVWEWLERRRDLPRLAAGLAGINRPDLVDVLQANP